MGMQIISMPKCSADGEMAVIAGNWAEEFYLFQAGTRALAIHIRRGVMARATASYIILRLELPPTIIFSDGTPNIGCHQLFCLRNTIQASVVAAVGSIGSG